MALCLAVVKTNGNVAAKKTCELNKDNIFPSVTHEHTTCLLLFFIINAIIMTRL